MRDVEAARRCGEIAKRARFASAQGERAFERCDDE
jgi:hypothetical protein